MTSPDQPERATSSPPTWRVVQLAGLELARSVEPEAGTAVSDMSVKLAAAMARSLIGTVCLPKRSEVKLRLRIAGERLDAVTDPTR